MRDKLSCEWSGETKRLFESESPSPEPARNGRSPWAKHPPSGTPVLFAAPRTQGARKMTYETVDGG